jgi:hypothetical protein
MRYLALVMLMLLSHVLSAAVAVVNRDVPQAGINTAKLRDWVLGRSTTYENGQTVVIVLCMDVKADAAMTELFGRSAVLLLRGWKRLMFSGSGAMPLQAETVEEALALVARTPGAITVLPIIESAPMDCRIIKLQNSDP